MHLSALGSNHLSLFTQLKQCLSTTGRRERKCVPFLVDVYVCQSDSAWRQVAVALEAAAGHGRFAPAIKLNVPSAAHIVFYSRDYLAG